jgi:hypothetical protein
MTGMTAGVLPAVLAHQGGWDEVLLVAAPLSIFAGLLYLANRRADHLVEQRRQEPDDPDDPGDPDVADDAGP